MSNPRRQGGGEPPRPTKKKKSRRWLGYTLLVMLGIMLGIAGLAASFVYKAYQTLPAFEDFDPNLTSVILDAKGQVVYKLAAEEDRTPLKDISQVPKEVQWAFVDTEDRRFYQHFGIDVYRLGGAVWSDVKYAMHIKGSQLEGGSTITMQLARNAFLTLDQTPMRKMQEMLIAIQLEKTYTKDEILLRYLNQVSFGGQIAGLESAAQAYFSKSAKELTVSEAAMLAGILKGPSQYSPFENYEGAMNRRAIVLDLMVENGHLDKAKADALKKEKVTLKPSKVTPSAVTFTGDWYVDEVIRILTTPELAAKYGTPLLEARDLYSKGLKIKTPLNLEYQKLIQDKVADLIPKGVAEYHGKPGDNPQAAVVVMNHTTGEVYALTGGLEHKQMLGLNRASMSYRQPGSSMKPVVAYLPAIDTLGWGPSTAIDDSPPMLNEAKNNVWPTNYDYRYNGMVNMRYGLEQSLNAVAVRTLEAVTPKVGVEYAHKLGLNSVVAAGVEPNDQHLALALGGLSTGVTPLDMTAAYGVLGSLGMKTDPVLISSIENKHGETIYTATPKKTRVVRPESTWLMVDTMKGSILRGTAAYGTGQWHGWPAAGKTGTTEDWHDAWFIGFTSEIVTGVWTGYDNNEGRKPLPGAGTGYSWTGAGPPTWIWKAVMDGIYKAPPKDWERPAGLTYVQVCKKSGKLPSPLCPQEDIISDWFRKGYEPKQVDDVWTMAKVVTTPVINPATKQPLIDTKTKQPILKYVLWQEGCAGTPEDKLLIKRPFKYVKHPTDPFNFAKYWPADWANEVPTETCTPGTQPTGPGDGTGGGTVTPPPGNGTGGGGTTQPPGNGTGGGTTQPPGGGTTQPPGNGGGTTQPPGSGGGGTTLPPIVLPPR